MSNTNTMSRSKALWLILIAYIACIAAGAATLYFLTQYAADMSVLLKTLIADVVATIVIFIFSRIYKNSSFYDAYWSVIPPLLILYWIQQAPADVHASWQIAVLLLTTLWAIRLTANWTIHWTGMDHEDWRYEMLRQQSGKFAVLTDFFGIHMFPTLQVFIACLPAYIAVTYPQETIGLWGIIACLVTLAAIAIEMIADIQLHSFIANKKPGEFINQGLWSWSRHPNYFGELSFWWGLMFIGLAANIDAWWWATPGALFMAAMFIFASIPMMDKRSAESREGYADHMKKVSALIPLPPKS